MLFCKQIDYVKIFLLLFYENNRKMVTVVILLIMVNCNFFKLISIIYYICVILSIYCMFIYF